MLPGQAPEQGLQEPSLFENWTKKSQRLNFTAGETGPTTKRQGAACTGKRATKLKIWERNPAHLLGVEPTNWSGLISLGYKYRERSLLFSDHALPAPFPHTHIATRGCPYSEPPGWPLESHVHP